MSLTSSPLVPSIPQFPVAIICSKSLDNAAFIPDLVGANVAAISHLYSNGANPLVAQFAADHGIPHTIFPLTGGRSFPWALTQILEHAQFVYVIGDQHSHGSEQAIQACIAKGIQFKEVVYDSVAHWKEEMVKMQEQTDKMRVEVAEVNVRLAKVSEIVDAIPKEERTDAVKAIRKVL